VSVPHIRCLIRRPQWEALMIKFASCFFLLLIASTGALQAQSPPLFPVAECMTVADSTINVRFGYQSLATSILNLPVTPEDNIFIGGGTLPSVGQPTVFVPGRHRDVFRVDFDLLDSPSYTWVIAGRFLRIADNLPLCRDREQRQVIGMLECVQPPGSGNPFAQARFAYINTGATLTLPQRSSRNYFAHPGGIFSPASERGQPTQFAPGLHRNAFTVQFDPVSEPLLIWEIDGEPVPAALDLPHVPLCTPLANLMFADGFEPNA
jgi:hypothetical protein